MLRKKIFFWSVLVLISKNRPTTKKTTETRERKCKGARDEFMNSFNARKHTRNHTHKKLKSLFKTTRARQKRAEKRDAIDADENDAYDYSFSLFDEECRELE